MLACWSDALEAKHKVGSHPCSELSVYAFLIFSELLNWLYLTLHLHLHLVPVTQLPNK